MNKIINKIYNVIMLFGCKTEPVLLEIIKYKSLKSNNMYIFGLVNMHNMQVSLYIVCISKYSNTDIFNGK